MDFKPLKQNNKNLFIIINKMKKLTIENICKILLRYKIPFRYSVDYLKITRSDVLIFETASFHSETKELIFMDGYFNKVDKEKVLKELNNLTKKIN